VADLLLVFVVFFRLGLVAFGGGTGVIPELERQLVLEHGWLTHQEFVDSYALAQLKPGPALLMVMFAGYKVAGAAGAVTAMVGMILPSGLLAALVTANWGRLNRHPWLRSVQRALAAVAFGLVAAGAYSLVKLAVTDALTTVIALGAMAALWYLQPHPALVILAGGAVAGLAGLAGLW
jgi:chromate transporter